MCIVVKLRKARRQRSLKLRPELLLGPGIPGPLHGMAPRVILGSAWWNETRLAALKATDHHCLACGVYELRAMFCFRLEAHEVYKIDYRQGRLVYVETVPLCHACHSYVHSGRLKATVSEGTTSQEKYDIIMERGDELLKRAKLSRPSHDHFEFAARSDWRLVLNGVEYAPKSWT